MKPSIQFKKIWSDDEIIELNVKVCDGQSLFSNTVYIGINGISELVSGLKNFRLRVHGGTYDIEFGGFGPNWANGAFHAQLHFHELGKGALYISTHQESSFEIFKVNEKAASNAHMYLTTEAALLDNFIAELGSLDSGNSEEATMQCIG